MIVAIVTFNLAQATTLGEITKTFQGTAPKYQRISGLLRKNYWMSEDGRRAGGSTSGRRAQVPTASTRRNGRRSSPRSTARHQRSSTCTRP